MKKRLFDAAPLFVCALLVLGISELTLKAYDISISYPLVFAWALIFVVSLYLILLNKKIALAVFAILVTSLVLIYFNLVDETKEAVQNFISSSFSFLMEKGTISIQQEATLGIIITFAFSLVFIVPIVIYPFYPSTFILSLLLLFGLWDKNKPSYIIDVIIIFGCLATLFTYKHSAQKEEMSKRIRGAVTLWLIPLMLIIMSIIYSIAIEKPLNEKSKWLEIRKDTIADWILEVTGNTSPRSVYSIASSGYSPLGNRLGGPIEISGDKVMNIKSNYATTLYLRGNIKNTYTGQNWIDDSISYRSRMVSRFKQDQTEVFNLYLPNKGYKSNYYFKDIEFKVTPLTEGSATIFTPNRVINVRPEKALTMLISFNTEGEVFASRNINEDTTYIVSAEHLMHDSENFYEYVYRIQTSSENTGYPDENFENNYARIFEATPENIYQLAQVITDGIDNDYLKALAIKQYLENGFSYTLTPEVPPEGSDFVSYFLQTKEGYCTYYASTMAVLARSVGLPSRYVEGYKVDIKSRTSEVIVTRENAHAWAEIYIKNFGWLTFDPITATESTESSEAVDSTIPEDIIPEVTPMPDVEIDYEETSAPSILPYIIIISSVLFLIVIIALFIILSFMRANFSHIHKKHKTSDNIAKFYFSEIMIMLSYIKYEKPIGFTLNKYAKGVDKKVTISRFNFKDLVMIINKLLYSKSGITKKEALYVYGYYMALRYYIRSNYGHVKYIYIMLSMMIKSRLHKS